MRLRELSVENSRGLRRARLELDRTAVLIGENGSGKSSLLDALALGLGAAGEPELRAGDFHRPERAAGEGGTGPIRIVYVWSASSSRSAA